MLEEAILLVSTCNSQVIAVSLSLLRSTPKTSEWHLQAIKTTDIVGDGIYGKKRPLEPVAGSENGGESKMQKACTPESYGDTVVTSTYDTSKHRCFLLLGWFHKSVRYFLSLCGRGRFPPLGSARTSSLAILQNFMYLAGNMQLIFLVGWLDLVAELVLH